MTCGPEGKKTPANKYPVGGWTGRYEAAAAERKGQPRQCESAMTGYSHGFHLKHLMPVLIGGGIHLLKDIKTFGKGLKCIIIGVPFASSGQQLLRYSTL